MSMTSTTPRTVAAVLAMREGRMMSEGFALPKDCRREMIEVGMTCRLVALRTTSMIMA